ncbi:unnamed protein product [Cladocopium goreaui]|uniref:Guanine deaminase (Guanase) (Guanine aminase) (Guanine aminohydrolase) (GAH) n=1 Tax=Cladocopium goreaui TaxID=2562237 RepID=A0A9P1FH18_9DINO|nr:unnamed protein product [Cladocopium goreaui]
MAPVAFYGTCVDTPKFGEIRGLEERTLLVVLDGVITSLHRGVAADEHRRRLEEDGTDVRLLEDSEVLLPGFIDTHIHFPQFPFTGAGIDKPLMGQEGFLTSYAFPTEESMAELGTARAVYGMAMETLLSHGTTTALIFASIHSESSKALVDLALQKQGPRAMVGKVCVDSDLAEKYNCMIQSHMSESIDEVEFSARLFGFSDAEVFSKFGLLRGKPGPAAAVMAHCVQMQKAEDSGASIAHCPLSNFFFAHGALPVKRLVREGIKVGLGTDVAGGYSPSMLSAMRAAVLASKSLQFRYVSGSSLADTWRESTEEAKDAHDLNHFEALYLATLGGASALGLAEHLGSFEEQKRFDAVLLRRSCEGRPPVWPTTESKEDLLLKIITLGDDRNVKEVFVDGRSVYRC